MIVNFKRLQQIRPKMVVVWHKKSIQFEHLFVDIYDYFFEANEGGSIQPIYRWL